MAFLDPKERVFDVEITQYGKFLLSKGKFKPEFYSFFDDDVLYDSQFAGYEESQNEIEDRITKETPILETQYNFSGRETEIAKINEIVRSGMAELGDDSIQPQSEKEYSLAAPLGTIRLDADKAPAWSIDILKGEISGAVSYKTGSHPTVRIPQLNIQDIEYKTFVDIESVPTGSENVDDEELIELTERFADGSVLRIYEDSLVLEINEDNTFFQRENFDIEVYEITDEPDEKTENTTREVLTPLYFRREKPKVQNDLLLDEEDLNNDFLELTPSYSEYFMDILVDREIDPELLCRLVPKERRDDLYNRNILDCRDKPPVSQRRTYDRTTTEVEEECD